MHKMRLNSAKGTRVSLVTLETGEVARIISDAELERLWDADARAKVQKRKAA
jgi:hypothetical protein